jgi:hypothetical protein
MNRKHNKDGCIRPAAGEVAKIPFLISSHVLRHSCGYKLAKPEKTFRQAVEAIDQRGSVVTTPADAVGARHAVVAAGDALPSTLRGV